MWPTSAGTMSGTLIFLLSAPPRNGAEGALFLQLIMNNVDLDSLTNVREM